MILVFDIKCTMSQPNRIGRIKLDVTFVRQCCHEWVCNLRSVFVINLFPFLILIDAGGQLPNCCKWRKMEMGEIVPGSIRLQLLKLDQKISGTIYRHILAANQAQHLEGVGCSTYALLDADYHQMATWLWAQF